LPIALITASAISLSASLESSMPLGLFVFEDAGFIDGSYSTPAGRKELLGLAKDESFKGKPGECVSILWGTEKKRRHILVGLGKKKDYSSEVLRRASGSLIYFAKNRYPAVAVLAPGNGLQIVAEGLNLASYRFEEYKKEEAGVLASTHIVVLKSADRRRVESALAKAALASEAVCLVRDLVNRGPSDKTPQSLADLARSLAGPEISTTIINREEAADLGMGSFLGVARGSAVEPTFIHMVYKPKGAKRKIGLVGKGITFDSGGLSLKPPASMETMKMDMAGAASVLGIFKILPRLKIKAEVQGFCAVTYNMPGPDALKPGDIVKAMNGKTIEVLNTDAEGRLVLADALVYATRQKLDSIIDLATLTGAVVVALGSEVTGAMGNNKPLMAKLKAAADAADEILCELPLVKDYKDGIKSSIADLQNIGKKRGEAGSIIGGLFLEEFVDSVPWVHLDIAGTAWADGGMAYCPKGGTGSVVRTLIEYLGKL